MRGNKEHIELFQIDFLESSVDTVKLNMGTTKIEHRWYGTSATEKTPAIASKYILRKIKTYSKGTK
jgi:hypothetical protein